MNQPNKRKIFLINRAFQLSIILKFFLLSLILIAIFYASNLYFFQHLKNEAIAANLPPDHIFFQFLHEQKTLMNKIFIFTSLASIVIQFVGGILLSHKVAGPLYRLTQHLLNSHIKDVKPVKFRKGDYFLEIEEAFNQFIEKK